MACTELVGVITVEFEFINAEHRLILLGSLDRKITVLSIKFVT